METEESLSFSQDFEDCGGYDTDDAPEIEDIGTQTAVQNLSNTSEFQKLTTLEKINKFMKEFHTESLFAATDQPDRKEEFLELIVNYFKHFKQAEYSNVNQIAEFELEKGRKRAMETQPRRSPKKNKQISVRNWLIK